MVLESSEASDGLAPKLEGRHAVGHALLGVGDDRHDGVAEVRQRGPLRLLKGVEIVVNLAPRHDPALYPWLLTTTARAQAPSQSGNLLARTRVLEARG